jgi:uncharacterized LabA/DUF88 family protein
VKTLRTVVFIDYQNMYKRARGAFWPSDQPGYLGNFKPLALARLLTEDEDRELMQVRVYSGIPAQERQKKDYEIMQRRVQAWKNADPELVEVRTRAMRYPPREGREKGVDVELAVDFVALAIDEEYELGIIASADTDLIPAIELVARRFENVSIETVAWEPLPECEAPAPLDIPGGGISRRRITQTEFANRLVDQTNYVRAARIEPAPGQSGRRLPSWRRRDSA